MNFKTLAFLVLGCLLGCLATTQARHADQPLILTPYIDANQIDLAKSLSSISSLPHYTGPNFIGYSAYLTVNESCNGNLFFSFFPHLNESKPILLWLQGGPGAASTFSLFIQNGLFKLINTTLVERREYTWTDEFHVLYIDNPVGTGYSFGDSDDCLSRDEHSVSVNLYEALKQFFTLFSEYKENPFFLTGESYAGKYVPALGYLIHKNLNETEEYFNFKGMAIGNGFIDPYNQIDYAEHLHVNGLIDSKEASKLKKTTDKIRKLIKHENYEEAVELFIPLVFNSDNKSMLYNYTGSLFHYNIIIDTTPQLIFDYDTYMQFDEVRKAFHVYPIPFKTDDKVGQTMRLDILKTIKHKFAVLAENYPTLLYNGQLDIICPPFFTEVLLNKLDWKYSNQFYAAERKIWRLEDEPQNVAGFIKQVEKFQFAVIKRAGHMVPWDEPKVAFELIKNFVYESL